MKYISEERLAEIKDSIQDGQSKLFVHLLMTECKELNPWQPIESAPKNRKIMIFSDAYGWEFGWYNEKSARWSCYPHKPEAWMEIPEPSK